MKEPLVPDLTAGYISQASVADAAAEDVANDTSAPMSNLELLGSVAFAMSQSDEGADDCIQQPVLLTSTDLTENEGQMPGSHLLYVVPASNGGVSEGFATVLPQNVAESSAEKGNVNDNDCAQNISNTPSLFFTDHDNTLCDVGPIMFSTCSAVSSTIDRNDNTITSCLAGSEPSEANGYIASSSDSLFFNNIDVSLDSFSLTLLTNVVTS